MKIKPAFIGNISSVWALVNNECHGASMTTHKLPTSIDDLDTEDKNVGNAVGCIKVEITYSQPFAFGDVNIDQHIKNRGGRNYLNDSRHHHQLEIARDNECPPDSQIAYEIEDQLSGGESQQLRDIHAQPRLFPASAIFRFFYRGKGAITHAPLHSPLTTPPAVFAGLISALHEADVDIDETAISDSLLTCRGPAVDKFRHLQQIVNISSTKCEPKWEELENIMEDDISNQDALVKAADELRDDEAHGIVGDLFDSILKAKSNGGAEESGIKMLQDYERRSEEHNIRRRTKQFRRLSHDRDQHYERAQRSREQLRLLKAPRGQGR